MYVNLKRSCYFSVWAAEVDPQSIAETRGTQWSRCRPQLQENDFDYVSDPEVNAVGFVTTGGFSTDGCSAKICLKHCNLEGGVAKARGL